MLRSLLAKTFSSESLLQRLRSFRFHHKIVVLMYHEVLEDTHSCIAWTVVKESEFIRQLMYLREHFNILSLKEALSIMERGVVPNKPCAVLTFDDGYAGNRRVVLPIIKSLSIPITVFVATKAIQEQKPYWYDILISRLSKNKNEDIHLDLGRFKLGLKVFRSDLCGEDHWDEIQKLLNILKIKLPKERNEIIESIIVQTNNVNSDANEIVMPMTVEDVRVMAASKFVTLGAHSHTHDILTQMDEKAVKLSILTSKELLSMWTGQDVNYFAYPNGDFNDYVISVVNELGFMSAFTTKAHLWSKKDSFLTLPRIGVGRFDSLEDFRLMVSGFLA